MVMWMGIRILDICVSDDPCVDAPSCIARPPEGIVGAFLELYAR